MALQDAEGFAEEIDLAEFLRLFGFQAVVLVSKC